MTNFTGWDIEIVLEPEGKPLGRMPMKSRIYFDYTSNASVRAVQELCSMIGGSTVYLEARLHQITTKLIPVSGWAHPEVKDLLTGITTLINTIEANPDMSLYIFGSKREKWRVKCRNIERIRDAIDNETDRGNTDISDTLEAEPNGIRTVF